MSLLRATDAQTNQQSSTYLAARSGLKMQQRAAGVWSGAFIWWKQQPGLVVRETCPGCAGFCRWSCRHKHVSELVLDRAGDQSLSLRNTVSVRASDPSLKSLTTVRWDCLQQHHISASVHNHVGSILSIRSFVSIRASL